MHPQREELLGDIRVSVDMLCEFARRYAFGSASKEDLLEAAELYAASVAAGFEEDDGGHD